MKHNEHTQVPLASKVDTIQGSIFFLPIKSLSDACFDSCDKINRRFMSASEKMLWINRMCLVFSCAWIYREKLYIGRFDYPCWWLRKNRISDGENRLFTLEVRDSRVSARFEVYKYSFTWHLWLYECFHHYHSLYSHFIWMVFHWIAVIFVVYRSDANASRVYE